MSAIVLERHFRIFGIDLQASLRKKLKLNKHDREVITKEAALKALKSIERSSKIKSFVTKPIVFLLTGIFLTTVASVLACINPVLLSTAALVSLYVAETASWLVGCFLISMGLYGMFRGVLSNISESYSMQAAEARNFIQQLNNLNEDVRVILS